MTDETLSVGDDAPQFSAEAVTRQGDITAISLDQFTGKSTLVVYFYPKDETPGCTIQACSFRDLYQDFQSADSAIIGISPDSLDDHIKFAQNHMLPFPLLADPDHAIAEKFGAWKEKTNYGKTYMGIDRSTFIIDKSGKIAKIFKSVKVDQHAAKVLALVRSLGE